MTIRTHSLLSNRSVLKVSSRACTGYITSIICPIFDG